MAERENAFYVGIKDAVGMRRSILETAKESIQTLQLFEKLSAIRDEKLKEVDNLKGSMREIGRLISKLKGSLPKAKLRVKLHEHDVDVPKAKKGKAPKKKAKEPAIKSDLDKLEEELGAIESKLGSIQ